MAKVSKSLKKSLITQSAPIVLSSNDPNYVFINKSTFFNAVDPNNNLDITGFLFRFKDVNAGSTFHLTEVSSNNNAILINQGDYSLYYGIDNPYTPSSEKDVRKVFKDSDYDTFSNASADFVFFDKEDIKSLPGNTLVLSAATINYGHPIVNTANNQTYSTIKIEGIHLGITPPSQNIGSAPISKFVLGLPCPPAWKPGAPIIPS